MTSNWLIWLLSAGLAQGVFLAIALTFLNVRNQSASRLLGALVAMMSVMIAGEFLDALNAPIQLNVSLAAELAIGPLIYFFTRAVGDPEFRFDARAAKHFLPLAVASLGLAAADLAYGEDGFTMSNPRASLYVTLWALVKMPYFFTYAWASDRVLARTLAAARRRRRSMLAWVRRWFLILYALAAFNYLNFIVFIMGWRSIPDPDFVAALAFAAAIFSVGYFVMVNRQLLDKPVANGGAESQTETLIRAANRYLDEQRPFEDPDFTLAQLSTALRVDEASLSRALIAKYDGGFHELLNAKRVAAFDKLLNARENHTRTILDLAFEAGFNSKATFYRAFKAAKRMTPRAYRAQLIENAQDSASHPPD